MKQREKWEERSDEDEKIEKRKTCFMIEPTTSYIKTVV